MGNSDSTSTHTIEHHHYYSAPVVETSVNRPLTIERDFNSITLTKAPNVYKQTIRIKGPNVDCEYDLFEGQPSKKFSNLKEDTDYSVKYSTLETEKHKVSDIFSQTIVTLSKSKNADFSIETGPYSIRFFINEDEIQGVEVINITLHKGNNKVKEFSLNSNQREYIADQLSPTTLYICTIETIENSKDKPSTRKKDLLTKKGKIHSKL